MSRAPARMGSTRTPRPFRSVTMRGRGRAPLPFRNMTLDGVGSEGGAGVVPDVGAGAPLNTASACSRADNARGGDVRADVRGDAGDDVGTATGVSRSRSRARAVRLRKWTTSAGSPMRLRALCVSPRCLVGVYLKRTNENAWLGQLALTVSGFDPTPLLGGEQEHTVDRGVPIRSARPYKPSAARAGREPEPAC